ncbi:MAG: TIGR03915 family putative DNA repair protein [Bacteroidota bacterium]
MTFIYDGQYEGLLSAVFESYRLKAPATRIVSEAQWQESLFDQPIRVNTCPTLAARVQKGLKEKTSAQAVRMLYRCFLSEKENVEMLIYQFIRKAMKSNHNIEQNYADPTVLALSKINKMIGREVHRMHAFVRFQLTKDGIYYAVIEPDFNVLPISTDHFEKRYPAMDWLIYDARRHYGMYYHQQRLEAVTFADTSHHQLRQLPNSVRDELETDYQEAWKRYFKSTNIEARKNMKLHLQHVPRRYWKYLVEKDGKG